MGSESSHWKELANFHKIIIVIVSDCRTEIAFNKLLIDAD